MAKVVHFEIHAENPERAVKFYTAVFGWEIKKWDNPGMDYWLVTAGSDAEMGINGAIMKRRTGPPEEDCAVAAFVCTISVENLDETLKNIDANGGKEEMGKMPVQGIGWLAYCKDTEGNIFGVMQNDAKAR